MKRRVWLVPRAASEALRGVDFGMTWPIGRRLVLYRDGDVCRFGRFPRHYLVDRP